MYKILIIEDDAQISIALKLYFEKNGYQVIQAVNCQEAGYAISKKPDIILADIGLPDGSGIELYKRISMRYKIFGYLWHFTGNVTGKLTRVSGI